MSAFHLIFPRADKACKQLDNPEIPLRHCEIIHFKDDALVCKVFHSSFNSTDASGLNDIFNPKVAEQIQAALQDLGVSLSPQDNSVVIEICIV